MLQTHVFPNGLRLVYEQPQNSLPITAIYTFCKFGSAYEPEDLKGAAHFIEHMCFKGTKKIPQAKDIFMVYDRIGALFNAYTVKQYTCYTVKCEDTYFENCLNITSDMLMNSTFKKAEYEKEHKVVIEENVRNLDDSDSAISKKINELIYAGGSYAEPIDDIQFHGKGSLEHSKVVDLYRGFYHPSNIVLSIVTHVPFQHVIKAIGQSFFIKGQQRLCSKPHNPLFLNLSYTPQSNIQYSLIHKPGKSTAYLQIGFRTCSQFSDDKYALKLLQNILSGSLSSRLFMILREENGLTYKSAAYTKYFENLGDFSIYAETDPTKLIKNGNKPGVLPIVIKMIQNLRQSGITQEELTHCKSNLKGKMILGLDDVENQAEYNGKQYLLYREQDEKVRFRDVYEKRYKSITRGQINALIKKYFIKANMTVCILGTHLPELKTVENICS